MKGLWAQTLAWLTAVAVAVLLAVLGPEWTGAHNILWQDSYILNGASPR